MKAIRVRVRPRDEDLATTVLWERGTLGIEVRENGPHTDLTAYFDSELDRAELQRQLPFAELAGVEVAQVDLVGRFREGFRAFQAGRFRITPVWDAIGADENALVVDPGRAFGTGTHETTRLCLAALDRLASRRPLGRTLDLGAGTGILSIAAARLGASPIVASDIDAEATASSRLHAGLNRARVAVVQADGGRAFRAAAFDLVLANLMALLLVDRAAEIRSLLARGGALVLSGLLLDDVADVKRAFDGCGAPAELQDGDWAALVYEAVT